MHALAIPALYETGMLPEKLQKVKLQQHQDAAGPWSRPSCVTDVICHFEKTNLNVRVTAV